jgi:integrase
MAASFRSRLLVAQREGLAFDETTGLPEPMAREAKSRTWYEHAIAYVNMKWTRAAPKRRRSIAESLATVTPALLASERSAPSDEAIRAALYGWAFNKARRDAGDPPAELVPAVRWLEANTIKLSDMADAAIVRKALDLLATLLDGRPAAANTVARKQAVFYGVLRYAVELKLLGANPIDNVQWATPKSREEVDRRVVVNPVQAVQLLDAVKGIAPELVAFFGCLYYAALRPAEALHLVEAECELPSHGWGWLRLTGSTQHVGQNWADNGEAREDRGLKHRASTSTRDVPVAPPLVRLLRWHIDEHGVGRGGRLFSARGNRVGAVSLGPTRACGGEPAKR